MEANVVKIKNILGSLNFGGRTAEEEFEKLNEYFVETDIWRRIIMGNVDIVYGPKGSGKSALYSLLLKDKEVLTKKGIVVVPAENPRGTSVFGEVAEEPPTSEEEFKALWKLYTFLLVVNTLRDKYTSLSYKTAAESLINTAVDSDLLSESLSVGFGKVRRYVSQVFSKVKLEGEYENAKIRIVLTETQSSDNRYFIDKLLKDANQCLKDNGIIIWIAFDRLDNAFGSNLELERNALRALFRVYLDLMTYQNIGIKIFLRNDIWKDLTKSGFREASHITKTYSISWNEPQLLNLVIKRLISNPVIQEVLGKDYLEHLTTINKQEDLFYKFFPAQVDLGEKKKKTFGWLLSRTADGTKATAPRELIHILNESVIEQLRALDIGKEPPTGENLFTPIAVKEALAEVSRCRLEQTIYAEYPADSVFVSRLDGQKTKQSIESLQKIWSLAKDQAEMNAERLVELGIFEKRANSYWVPFLYRPYLHLIQGDADPEED